MKKSFSNYLVEYGILKKNESKTKSTEILLAIQPTLESIRVDTPSKYVDFVWQKALENSQIGRAHV